MKKAVLVARIAKFFTDFEISDIKLLQSIGYEVWCVGNYNEDASKLDNLNVHKVDLPFGRFPISKANLAALKELTKLMQQEQFDLCHCHMPVGAVFARLAAHRAGLKNVIYTAHGLQFCQGGPKKDWILYYPVEKFLSRWTDCLITINDEDYDLAQRKFHMRKLVHLNGVGVDTQRYAAAESKRAALCGELGIPEDAYLLLSVGELTVRKNHGTVLHALAEILQQRSDIHYVIAGLGPLREQHEQLVRELGIEENVHFLGWRNDIPELCKSCDVFVFPSVREGLPMALMEAMAAGMPAVAARARGNTELITDGENGYLVDAMDVAGYRDAILRIEDRETIERMSAESLARIRKYDIANIQQVMREIYAEYA